MWYQQGTRFETGLYTKPRGSSCKSRITSLLRPRNRITAASDTILRPRMPECVVCTVPASDSSMHERKAALHCLGRPGTCGSHGEQSEPIGTATGRDQRIQRRPATRSKTAPGCRAASSSTSTSSSAGWKATTVSPRSEGAFPGLSRSYQKQAQGASIDTRIERIMHLQRIHPGPHVARCHRHRRAMTRQKQASPTPAAIRKARIAAGLTQTEAAQTVQASLRGWQQWEAGDRAMPPGLFELFMLKTGQWPLNDEAEK